MRPRTKLGVVKAAVLTAVMPLGLAACYGVPPTPEPEGAGKAPPTQNDPTTPAEAGDAKGQVDEPKVPEGEAPAPEGEAPTPEGE